MTDNVHRIASRYVPDQGHYSELQTRSFEFAPGEEGDGLPRRARRGVLRRGMFLLAMLGIGWAVYDDPSRVGRWWSVASEKIAPVLARALEQATTPARPVASVEPTLSSDIVVATTTPAPVLSAPYARVVVTSGPEQAQENAEANSDTAKPDAPKIIAALPPVRGVVKPAVARQKPAPKRDRIEVRARSAGLHPKLSRVLLSRLSKTDFRNAGYAIRTALSKTADNATFKWPRRRKAGQAMFEVRFVPGAAKGCRRYVVTVEKNRWLTTALPIEKCGVNRRQAGRARKS